MVYTMIGELVCWIFLTCVTGLPAALLMGVLVHRKLRHRRIVLGIQIRNPHGIAEERFVRIEGIDQWIGIRGENVENPVLLLIHGGPGSSCSIFTPLIRSWESHFTVVQWDPARQWERLLAEPDLTVPAS